MKILFLLSRIEKSGVALHSLDLAQGLVTQGHELHLITGGITDTESPYLVKLYEDFQNLGSSIKYFKTPKGTIVNKLFTSVISVIQILYWIRKSKADVIHSQSPYMTFLPWLAGKKFITTVHNVQLKKNLKYKSPTRLIAISEESREYAIRELGAKADTVSVVCHGISERYAIPLSTEDKSDLRTELGIAPDSIVIGFVGRITREKGLDILIQAIEEYVSGDLQATVQLIFLGDFYSEQDSNWLQMIMEASRLSSQIKILPFQDPKPLYNIFDIFVLPSNSEAFGLVCVEAMMCGACTIRTNTNGAEDQITHGEDGFIFPVGEAKALANIIETLLQNPQLISKIASKGQQKAKNKFTIEAMTNKTLEVYKLVI